MASHSEEDLMVRQIEQEMKPRVCVISKQGLTLFGYNVPWLVIVLVVVAVFFYLNKQGMLTESVSSAVSEPVPSVSAMTGGFKKLNLGEPGQVRQMLGQ
jgi:hypothetical protein